MSFFAPALSLAEPEGATNLSLGRALRDPAAVWPKNILDERAVLVRARNKDIILVADPKCAQEILNNRLNRYPRSRLQDRMLGKGYGDNLLQGDRADWRAQRRDIARPITSQRAHALVPRLRYACEAMLEEWAESGGRSPVDITRDARRLALDSLYRAFFANEDEARRRDAEVDNVARAISVPKSHELKEELLHLKPLAQRILAERSMREAERIPGDLNTLTLFLHAGHDNVAAALAWGLWLLSSRPDLQEQVRREWQGAQEGPYELSKHPTANAVVRETLRMFPPIMQLVRDVDVETTIGDVTVGPGATAIVAIYALHRSNRLWDRPNSFLPERFLKAKDETISGALWTPFGSGPRGCIGASLARIEMSLVISMICARFDLVPNPESPLQCQAHWALRPIGDAPIFAMPRY